jgi:dihydroxyacetone kinase-like protein
MPNGITTESLRRGFNLIAKEMQERAGELNEIDGRLGDGDIGITMAQGTAAVRETLPGLPEDVGMALMKCAQAFVGSRASSFGTLLATGLMSAAKACKGRTEVPWTEFSSLAGGAVEAMSRRGKSALGDKTVLDILEAIRRDTDPCIEADGVLEAATQAAGRTLDEFRNRPCRQGRARIFAERSVGLDDPGQVVIKFALEALANASQPHQK